MTNNRNFVIWGVIILILYSIFQALPGTSQRDAAMTLAFSEFMQNLEHERISDVLIRGNTITGTHKSGQTFSTYAPFDPMLVSRLMDKGVKITAAPNEEAFPSFFQLFLSWLPILLLIGFSIFSLRQIQSGGNRAMGFGKSRAKLLTEKEVSVTFDDVAGIDEAKNELEEIVDFLKDPQKFQRLGGKIPRGVLLVGPPGTGKTLLARAIAGEAHVPFFSISGSDFVEMFVGVGASRVRDMFEQAKKNAPCLVFIDEIDAVGRHRGAGLGGGNDEREQTLNQLLVEMDGFEENEGVIIIAATNRPDVLDPALQRPGRFDRQVVVPNPDINGREKILKVHMRKVPLSKDVNPRTIARGTPGFSGADLANLVNEAALMAARQGNLTVTMHEFDQAKDKILMGAERRSMAMSEETKRLVAYHEGGHALISYHLRADTDPIHKATIIPRGQALGMVMKLPENDRVSVPRKKLLADLQIAMGGRLAEFLIFGEENVTTGAASDIRFATNLARHMITECGMSDKLGFQTYGEPQQEVFLGHSLTQKSQISEHTAQLIDTEVHALLDQCYKKAHHILTTYIDQLHLLAKYLLERETLTGQEIDILLQGGTLAPLPEKEEKIPTGSIIPDTGSQPASTSTSTRPPMSDPQSETPPSS